MDRLRTEHPSLRALDAGNAQFIASPAAASRSERASAPQHPIAVVICCSDSRIEPVEIFGQNAGDIFVIRTAGATYFMDDIESRASVEYAVKALGVDLVVVMAHTGCGAVSAAATPGTVQAGMPNLVILLERIRHRLSDSSTPVTELSVCHNTAQRVAAHMHDIGATGTTVVQALCHTDTGAVEWLDSFCAD